MKNVYQVLNAQLFQPSVGKNCILYFSSLVAVIFFFLFLFLVYFLYVVCECVPSVIFPVQRTTIGVGDRPNRHNVRTTTTFIYHLSPMGPINELQRCPSRVCSQGIYLLISPRFTPTIFSRDADSALLHLVNHWLNFSS